MPNSEDYHILYVQKNEDTQADSESSPVLFRSLTVKNLPIPFVHDFALEANGTSILQEFKSDASRRNPGFHIIVSTGSGTGLASAIWQALIKPACDFIGLRQEEDYAVHVTTSENSVTEFTSSILLPRANLGETQRVMILSGDGGVVDTINSLLTGDRLKLYKKPDIILIPVGTGNALAHSAGITDDDTMGLKTWFRGTPTELQLFCASFSPGARLLLNEAKSEQQLQELDGCPVAHGAVVCSWGLHAGLVADSDTSEYRKFGAERFKMAAKEALFPSDGSPPHVYKAKVLVRRASTAGPNRWGEIRNGHHAYILATLVSHLEKGFNISPASKPLDGKLRLVQFGPLSGEEATAIMGKAYQDGQHIEDERIGYEEIEALRIEFDEDDGRWRRVCVDGKIIRVEKGGWVEVSLEEKRVVDLTICR